MKSTACSSFSTRSSEWAGDMTVWLRENGEDNSDRLSRLRRQLRRAREQELTPRQQQVLAMRYDRGMRVTEIAKDMGVAPSTVSRTLARAERRLRRFLQYAL